MPYRYELELTRKEDGAGFGRREVSPAHLEPAHRQVAFQGQRRGLVPADPGNGSVREQPVFHDDDGQISALTMTVGEGAGRVQRQFGPELFEPAALGWVDQLVALGHLEADSRVEYRVYALPTHEAHAGDGVTARVRQAALPLADGRLDEWLAAAEPVGTIREEDYPVFVTGEVLEQSEAYSGQGRQEEGGAWLVGNLYRQTEPRSEIFAVIHTALEARYMAQERFAINPSSQTFLRLSAQLERRRKRLGRVGELAMGFYHTHPFLPSEVYGHDACTECERREECHLTSAFVSRRDARFFAALFGRAPHSVQMVRGLTPVQAFDLRMFCGDGGGFRQRGYFRLKKNPHPPRSQPK